MSKLIKNLITIFMLSMLMVSFTAYQWPFIREFSLFIILSVFVGVGLIGSFVELYFVKFGDLKNRKLFQISAKSANSDVFKLVEVLTVRLALKTMPDVFIYHDDSQIIKICYKNFNYPQILISTKCIESYSIKELEFALALKLSSIKNGNDSAFKIYQGFASIFWVYPASIIKAIIDIEQSKNDSNTGIVSNLIYLFLACFLTLSGGFFAQLYLLFIEYYFDWKNYNQALVITRNKEFHFKHLNSDKIFSKFKLKFYSLLDQLYFDIQAKLNR